MPPDHAAQPPLVLFLHVRALPAWLALPQEERSRIAATAAPALEGARFRQFDCEAFTALCSDIWMLEAPSPFALHAVMERVRDTALFARPYFELVSILPAIEDGWRRFEASDAAG